jgi:DNA-binding beta-propeller fold protein YncE
MNPSAPIKPAFRLATLLRRAADACVWAGFFAALGLLATGCSSPSARTSASAKVVWPPPPDPARVAFDRIIRGPADLGVKYSVFKRFSHWLTGSAQGSDGLVRPCGIALDELDNLCFTDTATRSVSFFDAKTVRWRRWTKVGDVAFIAPVSVAKADDLIYVADSSLGEVIAFDLEGQLRFRLREHLSRPVSVLAANDRLWVADTERHAVCVFDRQGAFLFQFGQRGTGPGDFNFPTHLAMDAAGRIYVTDSMNCRIQIFDATGKFLSQIGSIGDSPGHFSRPKGVAISPQGHIYVADALFDNLQLFNPAGRLLLAVGERGAGPGEFCQPVGLAIARDGRIFVADYLNGRIQVLRYLNQE